MWNTITRNHLIGFAAGIGVTAMGFFLYKRNQAAVDEFLRSQGISIPSSQGRTAASMSLEELLREKERLEDLIAERELMGKTESQPS